MQLILNSTWPHVITYTNQGNSILALLLKAFSIPLLVWTIFPLTLFLQDQKGDT